MPLQILKSVDIVYLYFVTVYDPIDVKVWLLTAFSAWEIQWVVAGNKHSFIHSFESLSSMWTEDMTASYMWTFSLENVNFLRVNGHFLGKSYHF